MSIEAYFIGFRDYQNPFVQKLTVPRKLVDIQLASSFLAKENYEKLLTWKITSRIRYLCYLQEMRIIGMIFRLI